jgi:hypothetical protein
MQDFVRMFILHFCMYDEPSGRTLAWLTAPFMIFLSWVKTLPVTLLKVSAVGVISLFATETVFRTRTYIER